MEMIRMELETQSGGTCYSYHYFANEAERTENGYKKHKKMGMRIETMEKLNDCVEIK